MIAGLDVGLQAMQADVVEGLIDGQANSGGHQTPPGEGHHAVVAEVGTLEAFEEDLAQGRDHDDPI